MLLDGAVPARAFSSLRLTVYSPLCTQLTASPPLQTNDFLRLAQRSSLLGSRKAWLPETRGLLHPSTSRSCDLDWLRCSYLYKTTFLTGFLPRISDFFSQTALRITR